MSDQTKCSKVMATIRSCLANQPGVGETEFTPQGQGAVVVHTVGPSVKLRGVGMFKGYPVVVVYTRNAEERHWSRCRLCVPRTVMDIVGVVDAELWRASERGGGRDDV